MIAICGNNMPWLSFDSVADIYDETRVIDEKLLSFYRDEVEKYLKNNFYAPYKLLSIGIGTGRTDLALNLPEVQIFGVDVAFKMLKKLYAKPEGKTTYIAQADGCLLPFRESFNLSIAIHVFHLIKDWQKLLDEIKRVSSSMVIGEIYPDLYSTPLFAYYRSFLANNGWKHTIKGIETQELIDKIDEIGCAIKQAHYTSEFVVDNDTIYQIIKNRHFSSFWTLPEELHHKAIKALEEFKTKRNISIEEKNKVKGYCKLFFIKF